MPEYRYLARNAQGKKIRGSQTAQDESALYRQLQEQGLFLLQCSEQAGKTARSYRLTLPELSDFCQQLGTLLGSSVPLVRALTVLADNEGFAPRVRKVCQRLLAELRQGSSFSAAMEQLGSCFPPLMVNMFRALEGAGNLAATAMRMAVHYAKEHKTNQKVKSALTYPIVVLVMAVLVVVFVMVFVIPSFADLFAQMGTLPLPTRMIMALSNAVRNQWMYLLIGLVCLVLIAKALKQFPSVQIWIDRCKLKLPFFGSLNSTVYTARFARTLSSLYTSGMPVLQALQVSRSTIGNAYIDAQFDLLIEQVRRGVPLSAALDSIDGLRKKLSASVQVGGESGSLETMLGAIAEGRDYEADRAMQKMISLLEPLMLVVMALVVGFIVIAVMLPIFNSYSLYGNDIGAM